MDRISNLPDHLIEKILLRMPIIDAVRTSVLSTSWQYKWTTLPKLSLSFDFAFRNNEFPELQGYEFIHKVNSVLLQHVGPLEKLKLIIPGLTLQQQCYLNQSIRTVLLRGVNKLDIYNIGVDQHAWSSSYPPSSRLTHLDLSGFTFGGLPSLRGFPNLQSLHLDDICCTSNQLSSIISNFPNLETIKLHSLHLDNEVLLICAPKLAYLSLRGDFRSVSLQGPHRLRGMELHMTEASDHPVWEMAHIIEFFGSMDRLEYLRLGGYIYKVLGLLRFRTKLPKGLGEMRFLAFDNIQFDDAEILSCILCLIGTSINLRRLEIDANNPVHCGCEEYSTIQMERYKDFSLPYLEQISIGPLHGIRNELDITQFLLRCTPSLQVMSICSAEWPTAVNQSSISDIVSRFHLASSRAKIDMSYLFAGLSEDQILRRIAAHHLSF